MRKTAPAAAVDGQSAGSSSSVYGPTAQMEWIDTPILTPYKAKLAVHILGHRDDAADTTQEILLKVVTYLTSFRAAILAVLSQEGFMAPGDRLQ